MSLKKKQQESVIAGPISADHANKMAKQSRVTVPANSLVDWCGRKSDDPRPILYFSGVLGKKHAEKEIHERTKLRFRCISYHYLSIETRVQWATNYLATHGVRMFLDSGAFSLQKNKTTTWEDVLAYHDRYAAYLHKREVAWDWFAPVDYQRSAEANSKSMEEMKKRNLRPVPVYHGNDPVDEFERLLDHGYKLICIAQPQKSYNKAMMSGDPLRRHYQTIFNIAAKYKDVALHGFSQTGTLMFEFPWYSTDSTSWCAGSSRGQIFIIDKSRRKISAVYLGETKTAERLDWRKLGDCIKGPFQQLIAKWGFTEEELVKDYMARISFNILVMQEATLDTRNVHTGSFKWQRIV